MAPPAQLRRRLKAHCLQIIPARRIVGHCDAMLVPKDDAGALKNSADGRIKLARYLRLRSPYRAQYGRHVEGRDLVHGAREQGAAVRWA